MNATYEKLVALIEEQQKGKENTDVYMVGEQLKDIAAESEHNAEILLVDLANEKMGIAYAAKGLQEYANKNRGNAKVFCITPKVADGILREFYGLDKAEEVKKASSAQTTGGEGIMDLFIDLF